MDYAAQFHAAGGESSDQRPASEVFKSSAAVKESQLKSRFSSTGQFTAAQLEAGDDDQGTEAVPEPEFDPEDKRCLYDRLQAQKDAKQEEWDKEHQFKNQMDHWRLDEEDAAFEEERVKKLEAQRVESSRQHEESAQFYKLARASQELKPTQQAPAPKLAAAMSGEKRKAARPLPAFKVQKAARPGADADARPTTSASGGPVAAALPVPKPAPPEPEPQAGGSLGLGMYGGSSSDDDDD